jgi:precorrin-2 dehydrogenase/sirohydrochlorin ferrochelatase
MEAFPAFYPLSGRRLVIAGEGEGAEAKARLMADTPATVARVSGHAIFEAGTYAGAALAFIAHADADICARAAAAAKAAGAPVNVVDHPELSDFHTPAIIDRGQVIAAIGTAGAAPIVAALLRAELEARIPVGLGRLAALFGDLREETRAAFPDLAQRRAFLRSLMAGPVAEAADKGDLAAAEHLMRDEIAKGVRATGRVWLIEAPAARDLISLRAARALAEADLLVLDEAVDPTVATLARRDAPRRTLAETDAAYLAREASEGRQAVVVASATRLIPLAGELAGLGAPAQALAAAPS